MKIKICIYELSHPRRRKVAMYVGKGTEKRSRKHWGLYLSKHQATNKKLLAWFDKIFDQGLTPSIKIREWVTERNWKSRERHWIKYWRSRNKKLCNIKDGGNYWPLSASILGSRKAHSKKNKQGKSLCAIKAGLGFAKWAKKFPEKDRRRKINSRKAAVLWHKEHPGAASKNGKASGVSRRKWFKKHPILGSRRMRKVILARWRNHRK